MLDASSIECAYWYFAASCTPFCSRFCTFTVSALKVDSAAEVWYVNATALGVGTGVAV